MASTTEDSRSSLNHDQKLLQLESEELTRVRTARARTLAKMYLTEEDVLESSYFEEVLFQTRCTPDRVEEILEDWTLDSFSKVVLMMSSLTPQSSLIRQGVLWSNLFKTAICSEVGTLPLSMGSYVMKIPGTTFKHTEAYFTGDTFMLHQALKAFSFPEMELFLREWIKLVLNHPGTYLYISPMEIAYFVKTYCRSWVNVTNRHINDPSYFKLLNLKIDEYISEQNTKVECDFYSTLIATVSRKKQRPLKPLREIFSEISGVRINSSKIRSSSKESYFYLTKLSGLQKVFKKIELDEKFFYLKALIYFHGSNVELTKTDMLEILTLVAATGNGPLLKSLEKLFGLKFGEDLYADSTGAENLKIMRSPLISSLIQREWPIAYRLSVKSKLSESDIMKLRKFIKKYNAMGSTFFGCALIETSSEEFKSFIKFVKQNSASKRTGLFRRF